MLLRREFSHTSVLVLTVLRIEYCPYFLPFCKQSFYFLFLSERPRKAEDILGSRKIIFKRKKSNKLVRCLHLSSSPIEKLAGFPVKYLCMCVCCSV